MQLNKLIFPSPRHDLSTSTFYLPIKSNLIYLPVQPQTPPPSCFCTSTSSVLTFNNSSNLPTARSINSKGKIVRIKPVKNDKIKGLGQGRNVLSARIDLQKGINQEKEDSKGYYSMKTTRESGRKEIQQVLFSHQLQHYLQQKKQRFISEQLYSDLQNTQAQGKTVIGSIAFHPPKLITHQSSPSSLLLQTYTQKPLNTPSIPCFFLPSPQHQQNKNILVYFHGNGQDIIGCAPFLRKMGERMQMDVLGVQYPGYAMYEGTTRSQQIQKDAVSVMEILIDKIGYKLHNIHVIGRSVGSGPALYLSSLYPISSLTLLSPFLSLRQAVSSLHGPLPSLLVQQRFDNKNRAQKATCPSLIIHGKKDRMIPVWHATELGQYFRGFNKVVVVQEMTHSRFDFQVVLGNILEFINRQR